MNDVYFNFINLLWKLGVTGDRVIISFDRNPSTQPTSLKDCLVIDPDGQITCNGQVVKF